MEAAGSLDTLGLIARSIEDVALYRDVLLGVKPDPLSTVIGRAPRIGFCRTHLWNRCDDTTKKLLEECSRALAKAGARVEDVTLPKEFENIPDAHRSISSFEFVRNRAWEIDHHWEMISETLRKGRISHGLACSFEDYRNARAFSAWCRVRLDDVFADYDVLLTPAAAGEAPIGLASTGDASFCLIWTTMHVPAITLPLFTGPNGLPIGAQLVAKRDGDRHLFEAARWVMRALQ
jgi:amidase